MEVTRGDVHLSSIFKAKLSQKYKKILRGNLVTNDEITIIRVPCFN